MAKVKSNAGKYKYPISIYKVTKGKDKYGFPANVETLVLQPYAQVDTTKGFTLITNGSDFEKALTRFLIRYPATTVITYDMIIKFRNKDYSIQYINNVDEANKELELQCKEITH